MHGTSALTTRQREILEAAGQDAPDAAPLVLAVSLEGPLDGARLRRAVEATVAETEALRLVVAPVPGFRTPRQSAPEGTAADWREENGKEDGKEDGADAPFDPSTGRPFRARLRRAGPERAVLTLAVSPLACDRGGLALLVRRIAGHYAGDAAPATIGQCRFAAWREELESSEDAPQGRRHWEEAAAVALDDPSLPYRRQGDGGNPTATVARRIAPAAAAATTAALATTGVPQEAALQAAWWILLSRLGGRERFRALWLNDPRRDYDMLAETVGTLEDGLPLALSISPSDSAGAVARAVAAQLDAHRDAQEHRPERPAGRRFSAGFALTDRPDPFEAGGLRWIADAPPAPRTGCELTLEIRRSGEMPAEALLHYDPSLFDAAAMDGLIDQALTALAALPGHPATPVAELPLATAADRALHAALAAPAPDSPPPLVTGRLALHARQRPDAPALTDGNGHWSYAALDRAVETLARHLRGRGVEAERRVALVMPRSAGLVIALHAVMRAGGAYVPVDPAWPDGRRDAVIAAARPHLSLTARDMADLLDMPAPDVALPAPAPGDAAYLLFTSGSTGTPKGVVIEHGQLAAYAGAVAEALDLGRCRHFALTSTVAADLGNTALFGALAAGGRLVIAGEAAMADGAAFARFIADEAIDCVKIVPSHLAALLDTPEPVLPATLVLGGEPAAAALLRAIRRAAPDARVFNHYGPTETTVGVLVHRLPDGAEPLPDLLPLSRPLPGCRILLLDPAGAPVPVGAPGELFIGGAQVARGYLDRPADPAFRPDPERPGERLYRTGDLARLMPDGTLRLCGRRDDQVKIRGFRVEPAEVEAALAALPGVAQAAVRVLGEEGARRLAAYAVAAPGATPDPTALRAALKERLPDAMVPADLLLLPGLPRLGNGKIDRAALPDPRAAEPARAATTTAADTPAAPLETLIAGLIAGLLERERVGMDDNLFDLGVHSLLVIKLVARLRKRLGVELAPGLVFEHPTAAALAVALRAGEAEPGSLDRAAA